MIVRTLVRRLGPIALFALLTVAMTWPQAARLGSAALDHQDVYFNMWRFGWFAHALVTKPSRLLDANIFYPEKRTLTFSDAMPVESALAAPMLWAGLRPVLVHNLMLLGAIVLSAHGAFTLARRLTGSPGAAITAGVIFAFVPYRFEHYMHMELQWTVWTPWAFWALHRTIETGRRRDGALTGLFVALQFLSSIYYGMFLATLLAIAGGLLLCTPRQGRRVRRAATSLVAGGALAGALVAPYALEYGVTARTTGPRPEDQVLMFSARPSSYTVATGTNLLYGARSLPKGRPERRLFPGVLPLLLAVAGLLLAPPADAAIVYLIALAVAFEMSLGLYGYSFTFLYRHVPAFGGLRAPARLGIYVAFFLALLAAWGHAAVERLLAGRGAVRAWRSAALATAIGGLLLLEYWVAPIPLVAYPNTPPQLYSWLARQPPGVIAELPFPSGNELPGEDPRYAYLTTFHWKPTINGYSGYYPPSYLDRVARLQSFPSAPATDVLRRTGVRYVVLHASAYPGAEVATILSALDVDPSYARLGTFGDGRGAATVYQLR